MSETKIRALNFYEFITSFSSISILSSLEGKLNIDDVQKAITLTSQIHPYLRMIIKSDSTTNQSYFFEKSEVSIHLDSLKAEIDEENWKTTLEKWSNSPRDLTQSLHYWKLISSADNTKHQLYLTINHSGIDGISIFTMLETFFEYLGKITEGETIPEPNSREFIDIIARAKEQSIEIPDLTVPEQYMPPLTFSQTHNPDEQAFINGCWTELDEKTTDSLLTLTKKHSGTIQGVIQTAFMAALIKERQNEYPLPQNIVNMAPINMRPYVNPPLDQLDCVSGSAGLIWNQNISSERLLWDIVKEATDKIKHEIEVKRGLHWWKSLEEHKPIITPTFMVSSIGKTTLKESYGKIKLTKIKLLGGAYQHPKAGNPGTMIHAYTVSNKLNITFAFTTPPITFEWSENFLKNIISVINALATEKGEKMTIGSFL